MIRTDNLSAKSLFGNVKIPLDLLAFLLICVVLFGLYGFTLTTNTVFICLLIIRIITYRIGIFQDGEFKSLWFVYLLLGGAISMTTLYKLYNPDKKVFTNIDHHTLKFTGYTSQTSNLCLIDGRDNPKFPPLFGIPGVNGYATVHGTKDGLVLRQNICQPVYCKTGKHMQILNRANLPAFSNSFTLSFKEGASLSVSLKDVIVHDNGKKYRHRVEVTFQQGDEVVGIQQDTLGFFVLRSMPLSDLIGNMVVPENFTPDWSLLRGISVLREIAGLPANQQAGQGFLLSIDTETTNHLVSVKTDIGEYSIQSLLTSHETSIPTGEPVSIGSGIHATHPIRLSMTNDGKLQADMDTQAKRLLPYEKDSLDARQTVIVTSDLQSMAEATTTSALYYPVLPHFKDKQQFAFALEYIPEETRVSLTCKMQVFGDETPGNSLTKRKDGTYLIHAGDKFTLERKERYLNPNFELQDFRSTVPFNATKGYQLILIVMALAGISLATGRGRVETRGETALWLGILALVTYRAFIAWRTSVFPPLEGINESRFVNSYLNLRYTFTMVPIALCTFILIPSLIYKLFILPKHIVNRVGATSKGMNQAEQSSRGIDHMGEGRKSRYWLLPGLPICILLLGGLATLISERLGFIFFPVLAFICCEYIYHRYVLEDKRPDTAWIVSRYISITLAVAVPLAMDTGFGIVFVMFLLLYFAFSIWYDIRFRWDFLNTDKQSMARRRTSSYVMYLLVGVFLSIMLFGPRMVASIFNNLYFVAVILLIGLALGSYMVLRKIAHSGSPSYLKYVTVICAAVLFVGGLSTMKWVQHKHRHFLYRSEIHFKDVDKIMMDNDFGSRDLARLFEASQNKWYLGYYMEGRAWEQAIPFSQPYELRKHFNKGVSWDTQKTDVVLNRYVIGEHSIWSVYVLIILFILLFTSVYVSVRGLNRYTLLGCGAILLLLCQAIFITLAVTNRFIFFGQDFPMLSQHSLLTVLYTAMLFGTAILTTLKPVTREADTLQYNMLDKKDIAILVAIFVIGVSMDPSLKEAGRNFNVGQALKVAREELKDINGLLMEYQTSNRDMLAKEGVVRHFKTDQQLTEETRRAKRGVQKPRILQSDYSQLMLRFDSEKGVCDTLVNRAGRGIPGISRFTASLYKIYRDQLSKENKSTDIIHLKANQAGYLQFNIAMGYYLLETPESDELSWEGNLLPAELYGYASNITVNSPRGEHTVPFNNRAERLDRNRYLSYDFPIYLAKLDNRWVAGDKPVFIARAGSIPFTVKNGANAYLMAKSGSSAYYMVLHNDDRIETKRNEHIGNQGGDIHIKGNIGRYFARNILVNGRRKLVFPMGEKFFYPYHVCRLAQATFSGDDPERRITDVRLSLSYPLTEQLHEVLSHYDGKVIEPHARGLIVADSDGKIKAMVTAKNPNRNNGYYLVNPNDEDEVGKLSRQFYLFGDNQAEEHTFGDLNLNYMTPGPGSSIKPLTFTSVASQVCYDWRKLKLYFNQDEQAIEHKGKYSKVERYSDIRKEFQSLWGDETLQGTASSYTDIVRYIERSSNYFNSLMVFMGFYEPEYLRTQLAYIHLGRESKIFAPYKAHSDISFPAFTLRKGDATPIFNFRHYVTNDGMGRHENGALAQGFMANFGLYDEYPQNLPGYAINRSRNLLELPDTIPSEYYSDYTYAFNRVSFLPDIERTSFQGSKDAITNTTLGSSPFAITPAKMAEMFGQLFSQNKAYRLTLNPGNEGNAVQPFTLDPMYAKSGPLYQDILSNYLFKGMNRVVGAGGTAPALNGIREKLEKEGYYLYGKTGTISHKGDTDNMETQLLALVISKRKLHDTDNPDKWDEQLKGNRFYVLYFSNADGKHNYTVIQKAINTVTSCAEFRKFMEGNDVNTSKTN